VRAAVAVTGSRVTVRCAAAVALRPQPPATAVPACAGRPRWPTAAVGIVN